LGSSASAFSSASRFSDFSTSKRPPQQLQRLLDFFDQLFGFGAHFDSLFRGDVYAAMPRVSIHLILRSEPKVSVSKDEE
jgi:hypothetical protein